jgi:hypothetical protein
MLGSQRDKELALNSHRNNSRTNDRLGRGKSVTEAQGEAFQGVATDADSDDSQMELVPARVCRRSREETSLRIPDSIVDGAPIPVASE